MPVKTNNSGFTLIEMAIVMTILGVLIATFFPIYDHYQSQKKFIETKTELHDQITASIGSFRDLYGRYPCPAPLTAQTGDPAYGREQCNAFTLADAPGDMASGVIYLQSQRAAIPGWLDNRTAPPYTTNPGSPRVILGALPFKELGMDEDMAYDAYGNRYMYAVTEHLSNADTYSSATGGIGIIDGSINPHPDNSLLDSPDVAHFVILSYGPNGNGGYGYGGGNSACPLLGLEAENCDFFTTTNARFRYAQLQTTAGNSTFDDILSFFTPDQEPLWQNSTANINDINAKNLGGVGIRTNHAQQVTQELSVNNEDVRIMAGTNPSATDPNYDYYVNQLCESDGTGCFEPSLIASPSGDPRMTCPPGEYITEIANGQVNCAPMAPQELRCGAGYVLSFDSATGIITCTDHPENRCPSRVVTLCGTPQSLSSASVGTTQDVYFASWGQQRWECQDDGNGNFDWTMLWADGECVCTPRGPWGWLQECPTFDLIPPATTGTVSVTVQRVCPYNLLSSETNNCVCHDGPRVDTQACMEGWVGNVTQTTTVTCNADPAAPTVTAAPTDYSACTCDPNIQTHSMGCPTNYIGDRTEAWGWDCTGASPDPSQNRPAQLVRMPHLDTDTCSCSPDNLTRQLECPTGYTGSYEQVYSYNCATGVETIISTEDPHAMPDPPCTEIQCYWTPQSSGQSASYGIGYNLNNPAQEQCTCGAADSPCHRQTGSQYTNYNTCSCF